MLFISPNCDIKYCDNASTVDPCVSDQTDFGCVKTSNV